jgi:DNA-binding NarL/FixJ family response regulator
MTASQNSDHSTNGALEQNGSTPGIRVILADSQAIYRVGMKKVFALEDDIRVVAQAESLANLQAALQRYPTDVVVLEGQLIAGTIDAIPDLVRRSPDAKLIVQVVEADESNIVELYRRGVRGVVPRSIAPDLLIKCVRKIADGETWIDNQSISWVIEAYRSQASSLTNPRVQPKLSKKELHYAGDAQQGDCLPDRHHRAGDQELSAQGVRQAGRLRPAGAGVVLPAPPAAEDVYA